MKQLMEQFQLFERGHDELLSTAREGRPVSSTEDNMDYYNSLQTSFANRYVVCQQGDFELARRFNREYPASRRGRRMRAG
jgi:hypothetical protein